MVYFLSEKSLEFSTLASVSVALTQALNACSLCMLNPTWGIADSPKPSESNPKLLNLLFVVLMIVKILATWQILEIKILPVSAFASDSYFIYNIWWDQPV